ncbi:general substrate transporter [Microdochium trichocladiopsis]|uniref:General substrate transporter n=1 Tax=Microdochium trichocladiopsis TaxID=1682393 RepID=A0A9P8Y5V2_9PEZI|nr:general substrate transporter [Microdochium trichocladiopsis]KAH7030730.1 general substrate transporter [Microdochium trichocladiopsis]
MSIFSPPKRLQAEVPAKPTKGHFPFAGREFLRVPWWRRKNLRMLYFYIVVLILTNTANGFDGSMMNGLQSLSYWQEYFDHPKGSVLGLFNASMSLGSLIGLLPTPYLNDWAGRRVGVAVGCVIMLLAVGLQSGAQNFGMFVAARLLLGLGDSIVLGSAPLLIAEIAHPQDRATLVTLSGASYHSGAFIASWVTYGTLQIQSEWSWRLPSLLQSICSVFILGMVFFMPESPRWLMDKDRHEDALRVFSHYHGEGDVDDTFVQLEYAEVKATIELEKQMGKSNWLDFLKTKGNRKRIGIITAIGFFSLWSGNGLISYYLSTIMNQVGITNPQTQLGINGGLKTQALIENITMSFFVDKIGRRPMYLISTVGTFVIFTVWTIISARLEIAPNNSLGYAFVAMIFCYGLFYDFKNGLLASYTTEILPYHLRAKGFTWLNFSVSLSLFFNQYINGIALDALHWKYYLCYVVFLAFEIGIIYFFIVETRYTPLEEIARYFDGDDAVDVREVANADVKEKGNIMVQQVSHQEAI